MMRVSVIITQHKWVLSYNRLQETAWYWLSISCYDTTVDKPQICSYPLGCLSLPRGPPFLGVPETWKQKSDWLSASANTSLLYHYLMEISEWNQPMNSRKRQRHWERSATKISLWVTKLCRTIHGALSGTHSNVSASNPKWILGDEKRFFHYFQFSHTALDMVFVGFCLI